MAGYSGTPLATKLGIKSGSRVFLKSAPKNYAALLAPLPDGVRMNARMSDATDLVHLFATSRSDLERTLRTALPGLRTDVPIWVSWPKKASGVPTDITEDTIRAIALPMGLVDIKVCAVDEVWSGLKLVVRRRTEKTAVDARRLGIIAAHRRSHDIQLDPDVRRRSRSPRPRCCSRSIRPYHLVVPVVPAQCADRVAVSILWIAARPARFFTASSAAWTFNPLTTLGAVMLPAALALDVIGRAPASSQGGCSHCASAREGSHSRQLRRPAQLPRSLGWLTK